MGNKLRRVFDPTPEEQEKLYQQILEIHNRHKEKRGCRTCKHCKHTWNYPGFVTAEECICVVGLKCDTVLDSVINCPKWEEKTIKRWWKGEQP